MCGAVLGVMYFVDHKNFAGFLTMFSGSFHSDRHRQWLDLSDDSLDLPRREAERNGGQGRDCPRARAQSSGARSRGRARLHRRSRRLRRLPHPARVRRLHCRNRWALSRTCNVPAVLHHLHRAQLVVLPAQVADLWPRDRVSPSVQPLPRTAVAGRRQRTVMEVHQAWPIQVRLPDIRSLRSGHRGIIESGDRLRNAADRLQARMWPLCVPAHSLRAFMSSIIR